ncbi:hypothetical protein BJF89_13840 [Corynebacterium sp. CNJ-954]|uniref:hypothetical protein n=1 Tax=Corynebacterium sp. CNJ-954 TaxID=1904962 RepID=UPI000963AABF|nr:hypothetical protein [Corynebacterium sp. CNJ-954]OLT55864.1 hypothetical protein BJF89_13840 [Corynebacterium sp. CNJ-954]
MSNIDDVVANAIDPEIIYTPAELEALDPDTVLNDASGAVDTAEGMQWAVGRGWLAPVFPAVVVASGAHLRACREALEGETP